MKIEIFGVSNKIIKRKYQLFAKSILKKHYQKIPNDAKALNIIIVNNDYIHKLNKQFLRRDYPTDVLAFPINRTLLGEIYISKDKAQEQARAQNISQYEETCHLIEHGILHLLGFSHNQMKKIMHQ